MYYFEPIRTNDFKITGEFPLTVCPPGGPAELRIDSVARVMRAPLLDRFLDYFFDKNEDDR